MNQTAQLHLQALLIGIGLAVGLFFGMQCAIEMGHRIALRRVAQGGQEGRPGLAGVEGAVFGLMGLLIAFTFSGAMARFDVRRQLITQEANCIGTAYTRLDLLPPELQPQLRDLFRQYLDSRLEIYRRLPDLRAASAELARSGQLQVQLWQQSLTACRQAQSQAATMLLVPALNQMFDIASTRTAGSRIHPPTIVFIMLYILSLSTAFLAGCSMAGSRKRNWVYILGFPFIISLTVYVIMDIEFPRMGLIRIDVFDRALLELRESMK